MMDLVLARHGQSQWNADRTGGPDSPLTELGQRQAERLATWLAEQYTFTTIYASPLLRARQTAEAINRYFELPIIVDDDLRESYERYEHARPPRAVPGLGAPAVLRPLYISFYLQVSQAARRIIGSEPSGTVLVVAHAGTIGTFVRTLLGVHSVLIGTDLAAAHHFRWANGRWILRFLNRNDHLVGL